jgi:hypothetical protein
MKSWLPLQCTISVGTVIGKVESIGWDTAGILPAESSLKMIPNQHRRGWTLIAVIAIGIALLCLLVPHSHSGDGADWLAILPLLFVGVISPLSLFAPLAFVYLGRTPDAPALPASFQRPPPFQLV